MENTEFMRLLSERILNRSQIEKLDRRLNQDALAVLAYLIKVWPARKEQLCALWGDSIGHAYVNLKQTLVQEDLVRSIPAPVARRLRILPLYRFGDTITVATTNPENLSGLDEVAELLGFPVSPMFSPPGDISDALDKYFPS